ncbi:uncharacterized protein N7479_008547 [Penicillium vulpinum]|uniref:uncharacterized protein n=1 Tax=Penicillium vulpinum TaxID=29845 RepID=UPI00254703E0|nr:uncharacterized protein N7479_008547 [Penicillium vulpinum]KAJ5950134.1 hypothetical protein N7479_008547 [Penicillium vulpinum]
MEIASYHRGSYHCGNLPARCHVLLLSQNFQYFFSTIVQALGYGKFEIFLITAPVWIATFLVSLLVTWTSG